MQEEYNSLLKNQTWDLVPLPAGTKIFICRWVYRTKSTADGNISIYKARLVAKGFQQVHGIDYDETFTPVAKMDSIRLALAIVAAKGWEFLQMDVKNAFIHSEFYEEIYIEQPQGFMQDSFLFCRLKKSLYGLKRASRAWYAKMDSYFFSQNFVRCKSNLNVYMLRTYDSLLLLVLYIDNVLITSCLTSAIAAVKRILHDRFFMTNKCHILTTSVASVTNITLPSCLCRASHDITKTLNIPQRLFLKKRNHLTRSTNLFPLKKPLKNGFWRGALPYPLSRSASSPWASLGECFSTMCTLLGYCYPF
jgi:hypothetical protein